MECMQVSGIRLSCMSLVSPTYLCTLQKKSGDLIADFGNASISPVSAGANGDFADFNPRAGESAGSDMPLILTGISV